MSLGDRYQLTDGQLYLGQACLNVYYYQQLSTTLGNAQNLVESFIGNVFPELIACQNVGLTHIVVTAINLDDPTDFGLVVPTSDFTGLQTGAGAPPFVCAAFRYNRASRAVRNGQKRIGGQSEISQGDGVIDSEDLHLYTDLATQLGNHIGDGAGTEYKPVIMRKTVIAGVTTYTEFDLTSVTFTRISTQNTRKFGRGS